MTEDNYLEKYKKAQEKFNLPHINELKETFKFELDENERIFDQIRIEMSDRLFVFTEKIIEPMISEADSLATFFEQNMISEKERSKFFDLYAKIQMLKWENNLLSIDASEKDVAEWIKKTWNFWNDEMKKELISICKKLSVSWKEIKNEKEKTDYHS